ADDPRCPSLARELYEYLHRPLEDDFVLRPGVEIPVEVGRDLGGLLARLDATGPTREPEVATRLVIALLDGGAFDDPAARNTMALATARWTDARRDEVFVPILLDPRWAGTLQQPGMRVLLGIDVPDPCPTWKVPTDVGIIAGRALLRRLDDAEPPRAKVFISHARADGAKLARDLADFMNRDTRVVPWLDSNAVERGEELSRQLQAAASDGVLLVVRTDRYSESPWCGLELLAGKRARVPIVTLLAGDHGEPLASAYGGNHRTMTWREGREPEIVARCVQAWLHGHYFRQYAAVALALAGLPADAEILTRRPELLDIADGGATRRLIVHPDPPLTDAEATVLRTARPSVRLATPTTLFGRVLLARDPEPPLCGMTVAYSLSGAEELPRFDRAISKGTGLTDRHLQDVLNSIVVATVHSGSRIAYGGDFRRAGFSHVLSDLLRSRRRLGGEASTQLLCYLRPYRQDPCTTEAKREIEYSPVQVAMPAGVPENADDEIRSNAWHLALRELMAETTEARILLGGKTTPRSATEPEGYRGPWPGVLEEAYRTLRRNGGLFVIGGFGGAAGSIARILRTGEIPKELQRATWPHLNDLVERFNGVRRSMLAAGDAAGVANVAEVVLSQNGRLLDIEDLARGALENWQQFVASDSDKAIAARWTNGLTRTENERLFISTDQTEITYLVFEGLRRLARSAAPSLRFAAYLGDIALAPGIDGYAVTITPGVNPAGASVALDKRMGGRLAAISQAPIEPIVVVPAGGELTGSQVLVVRLDLPPAGQTMSRDHIVDLAETVARKADQLGGIVSIACAAFASTLGLSIGDAVQAMVAGFQRANARVLRSVVFCETSAARYRLLRDALGSGATELRSGPTAQVTQVTERSIVLHIEASEIADGWKVSSTLFPIDNNDAVVPRGEPVVSKAVWSDLRRRSTVFESTTRKGNQLWKTLLSEPIRNRLAQHPEQRLVVLTDENASGLPWEFLTDDSNNRIACQRGVVRRIALLGDVKLPDAEPRPDRRILLIVDPREDLPKTRLEADEIQAVLRDRPDIEVTRLDGPAATLAAVREQLATGLYDIFHYAGHASFDLQDRAKSGLKLADDVLTAAQLPDARPPRFVYLSGCESVRLRNETLPEPVDEPPNSQSLAEALLRRGVSALVGTFYAVSDSAAQKFAASTYREIVAGRALGKAVREARRQLENVPDWGNFMVYGDDQLII
ncbi:MAG TPA: CHAT domain-containing protein, partial [Kofleriaceae bacterium]